MKIKAILTKVHRLLTYLFVTLPFEAREKRFICHNKKVWHDFSGAVVNEGEILVEAYPVASSIISQAYLANCLARIHHAAIVAYDPYFAGSLRKIYNWRYQRIYRSFNTRKFMALSLSSRQWEEVDRRAREIFPELKTKKDVENIKIEGIWIGDLLYDSHLMRNELPTIDFADPRFYESLRQSVAYYVFWRDYLISHNVKAAIVSHCVYYENAVIVRLCIDRRIACYQVNATSLFSMDEKHVRAYNDYLYLPKEFRRLPETERLQGTALAKERLDLRFKGKVGVDMVYSSKSAYANDNGQRVLRDSEKVKILIAPHCFFDSPHPYGNNLFTDFYDWLSFLGEISNRTDYDWYIKTHPDVLPANGPVIDELVRKYPKFTLLPKDVSHLQIIRDGIDVALTVFGTISVEYPALGLKVINASRSNPHVAYDFALHVDNVEEYERLLLNLRDLHIDIDPQQVYEYYYMYHLNKPEDWLFRDYKKFLEEIGGYYQQVNPISYEVFLREFDFARHKEVIALLDRFVRSGEYCLFKRHLAELKGGA